MLYFIPLDPDPRTQMNQDLVLKEMTIRLCILRQLRFFYFMKLKARLK